MVGRLLVIHLLFIIDFCARAEGSRVHWEEDDGNVQRAVYAREQLSVGSLWLVFGLLVVYFRLRKSPVFSLD